MRLPIQVLVYPICLQGSEPSVLLLRRTPVMGGFWQGVTGGQESGETVLTTATRELSEETGLTAARIEQIDFETSYPVPDGYAQRYSPDVDLLQEFAFIAHCRDQLPPALSAEHDAWRWCSVTEALSLLKWSENKRALRICWQSLE